MRYELSNYEWTAIKPMLPNRPRGVRRVNNRRLLVDLPDPAFGCAIHDLLAQISTMLIVMRPRSLRTSSGGTRRERSDHACLSKPYPKPRPRSGTTLVVLVGAGPGSQKNADAFFGVPRKPALVRHSRCVRLIRAKPYELRLRS
jgi:hypothetical protein